MAVRWVVRRGRIGRGIGWVGGVNGRLFRRRNPFRFQQLKKHPDNKLYAMTGRCEVFFCLHHAGAKCLLVNFM